MTPRDSALGGPALEAALAIHWAPRPGFWGALASVDHKVIGRRYLIGAFTFLFLGGVLGLLIRLQLAAPESRFLTPDLYNQVFTTHGTNMMFLFAVPVMQAMAVYLVPLMVGTRNIAFPRLVAFSFWMFLAGGAVLWGSLLLNMAPDVGWFAYVPLSGPQYGTGKRADIWAQMITFTELSALSVAVATVVTILKQRAPGMTLDRIPLFVWAMLVTSFIIILAMPSIVVASTALILDRLVGTHLYNPAEGGDVLLWQHLFWFFGHPEVYIIFLPAVGMVSTLVTTFCRRPVFGYTPMVLALVATAFLSFGLWVHHMFTTGLPRVAQSYFTASSMAIAVPSGVQVFCWIATMWLGRPVWRVPFLYVLAFFFTFIIGGMTGVMVASVPLNTQLHDTYFVVAHFHYVLVGGAVFPLLGAVHYWWPKVSGRMPSETLGRLACGAIFLGFNLTFFPMHLLGLRGMTRRIYTYQANMGWGDLNLFISLSALLLAAGFVLFLLDLVLSLRRGAPAGDNPWGATTLEWTTSSPPPPHNFSRMPVFEGDALSFAQGMRVDRREQLITSVAHAIPQARDSTVRPSIWPLWAAVVTTIMLMGSIFTPWAIVWGAPPVALTLIGWFWPRGVAEDE